MHPDPSLQPSGRGVAELVLDALLDQRSIPPRADREQGVADGQAVAVAGDAEFANVADPARDLLAFRTAFVEIVIAGAEDYLGDAGQQRKIFFDDQYLGAEVDIGSDVERIAGEDDEIEIRGRAEQPVKLRKLIVQICDDEAANNK